MYMLLQFSGNTSYEVDKLDENSYDGTVINAGYAGAVLSFRKSFIIPTPKQLKHLVDPAYKTPTETNISRFLLKTESLVYSPSLSCHLSVVEQVCPIELFFRRKLSDFKGTPSASLENLKEEWWKSISHCFQRIFW